MAVDIGAALIDVFMVLVIAIGLVLLAAMVREQIPRRRARQLDPRSARTSGYGQAHIRVDRGHAA
jgi:hypothetical protein